MTKELRVWGNEVSGNSYKVKLLLTHLGLPFEWIKVDTYAGDTRTPDYLAKNLAGQAPLIETADGVHLPESGAILVYLAEGSRFLPADPMARAQTLRWMFFEQNLIEPTIAVSRSWITALGRAESHAAELAAFHKTGVRALGVLERHLEKHHFFPGAPFAEGPTIADFALYGYVHCAEEGHFDLSHFPGVRAWIARVAAQPGHIGMMAPVRAPGRYAA